MFELDNTRYIITKISITYKGRLTITRETVVNPAANCMDVFTILAQPESYEGERQEAIDELKETGITCYHNMMIQDRH